MNQQDPRFPAGRVRVIRVFEVECEDCDGLITDAAQGVESRDEADRIRMRHIADHRAGRVPT